MNFTQRDVEAGQAIYTPGTLAIYDLIVLGLSNRFIWKCPTRQLLAHYNGCVSADHLDVGVGSGYFLDRCAFREEPRIALMDLNPHALAYAARRIARFHPETYARNVLAPIDIAGRRFDSIGINYLLHCLPGDMAAKACVFDHLRPLMQPDAVIFGSTLLQGGVERNWAARRLMEIYNSKGIFSNDRDDLAALHNELARRFEQVAVEIVGAAALFSARAIRQSDKTRLRAQA